MTRPARQGELPTSVLDRAIQCARRHAEDLADMYGHHLLADLQSELVVRAWNAWETYRVESGRTWEAWMRDHFRYGVREVLREHNADRKKYKQKFLETFEVLSIHDKERSRQDPAHERTYEELLPADLTDLAARMSRDEWVQEVLGRLLPRERYIIQECYLRGRYSKVEVAARLNISPTRLRQIERQAWERIRALCCPDFE
jgi:RNA polymerase sigma factor (sigma-70 family)